MSHWISQSPSRDHNGRVGSVNQNQIGAVHLFSMGDQTCSRSFLSEIFENHLIHLQKYSSSRIIEQSTIGGENVFPTDR